MNLIVKDVLSYKITDLRDVDNLEFEHARLSEYRQKVETQLSIYVDLSRQVLALYKDGSLQKIYPISSSKYGAGNKEGSEQTPLGLHIIKEKIGSEVPIAGILKGRIYYGQVAQILETREVSIADNVTSRVLWLDGLEHGYNKGDGVDSYSRYIYLHGTDEEGLIGIPASIGCIRMTNKDIIEVFDLVGVTTPVLIEHSKS